MRERAPRYRELLSRARDDWWDERNFDKWQRHYLSEPERGRQIADMLARHADFTPHGRAVLDVGCGDAGVAISFAEAGAAPVAGVEPSRSSLRRGRVRVQEYGVDVELVDAVAEALPFPDASQDLLVLDNVLEHVQDRTATLSEAHRVLRPGALLYMVTPKPFSLHALASDPHYQIPGLVLLPPGVQRWYFERVHSRGRARFDVGVIPTRRGARRMLRRAGFELVADPRALWIEYLRGRLADADRLSSPLKRRAARALRDRSWLVGSPAMARLWDVALGSNYFIARRTD